MKKLFSLTMVCLLILGSVFPSYAYSAEEKTSIDGWELSVKRFAAKCNGTDDAALAESILSEIGMSETYIAQLPESKKAEIANAVSIRKVTEYAKITEDEKEVPLTEEEYLQTAQEIDLAQSLGVQPYAQGDNWHYSGSDSLFQKDLYIYETKNAPKGTFGIIVSYSWKNFITRYRGDDVISISGEDLIFDRDSFGISMNYAYTQTTSLGSTAHTKFQYYDMNNVQNPNDLWQESNGISFTFNLPNNIYTLQSSLIYTNADFLVTVSCGVANPDNRTQFNVYANYFHNYLGIALGLSVSINGASVSVSSAALHSRYQIQTGQKITYTP